MGCLSGRHQSQYQTDRKHFYLLQILVSATPNKDLPPDVCILLPTRETKHSFEFFCSLNSILGKETLGSK